MEIRLPLQEIREQYDHNLLEKVEHDLTEEDIATYDRIGWDNYRPEYHAQYLLPSLGEPLLLNSYPDPVVEIKGKRYRVVIESHYDDEPYEAKGKALVLTETDEPLTKGNRPKKGHWRGSSYYKFFGQPTWVQNESFPAHNGKPCYHLVTVENGWGDCGNWNILIGIEDDKPVAAYFEASCC